MWTWMWLLFPVVLGVWHLVIWLLTKGIIWITFELFNINWYGKFWVVYVFVFIINALVGNGVKVNRG